MVEYIPLFKSLHIIGFVAWFGGLFYMVRIFVYHTEAHDKAQPKKGILSNQFHIMERKVLNIICRPAMLVTWIFGVMMIVAYGMDWFKTNYWLHTKLVMVLLLSGYTDYCSRLIKKLKVSKTSFSSFQFRLFNEVPTLFLIAIVLMAVYRNNLNYLYAFLGILISGLVMYAIAKIYKKKREQS